MSALTARLVAPLALVALALGACSSDTTGPSAATPAAAEVSAAAASVNVIASHFEGVVQVPLGDVVSDCLAEPVEVHFQGQFRAMLVQTADGQRSISSVHMNEMGSWAVGLETGTIYRVAGSSLDRNAGGESGAGTVTSSGFQKYVGPGGKSFTVRSNFGFTVTPEGTLVVERISSTLECR